MSTTVKPPRSATAATKQIAQTLGLSDQKRLATAIAIAAAEEIEYNTVFIHRIRAAYDRSPATVRQTRTTKALQLDLKPIKRVEGFELNPAAPVNPYLVYEAFGVHQLRDALDIFSVPKLQAAARMVMERNPGTKPQNMRSKPALLDYIASYVANHR